jgi:hypothetical protein
LNWPVETELLQKMNQIVSRENKDLLLAPQIHRYGAGLFGTKFVLVLFLYWDQIELATDQI